MVGNIPLFSQLLFSLFPCKMDKQGNKNDTTNTKFKNRIHN